MTDLKKCGHQGLNLLNATDAAKQISAGKITSEQLVTDCLQRIQERDPRIGAWKFLDPAQALAQARACDNGERTGPLLGVPVGKDNFDTKICQRNTAPPYIRDIVPKRIPRVLRYSDGRAQLSLAKR